MTIAVDWDENLKPNKTKNCNHQKCNTIFKKSYVQSVLKWLNTVGPGLFDLKIACQNFKKCRFSVDSELSLM